MAHGGGYLQAQSTTCSLQASDVLHEDVQCAAIRYMASCLVAYIALLHVGTSNLTPSSICCTAPAVHPRTYEGGKMGYGSADVDNVLEALEISGAGSSLACHLRSAYVGPC